MKGLIAVTILTIVSLATMAQGTSKLKVAFYNVENLCDTINNPLINDEAFTPNGANQWDTHKYLTKINNIARVIDHINADVIALSEVENEEVIKDLVMALNNDYNYVHRNTSDGRGMDMAMLYRATEFYPQRVWQLHGDALTREPLVVEGHSGDTELTFVVCHMPSRLNSTQMRTRAARTLRVHIEKLMADKAERNLILMGDFNATPNSQIIKEIITSNLLFNPFTKLDRQGYGTYTYRDRRYIFDQIMLPKKSLTSSKLSFNNTEGIFTQGYMLKNEGTTGGYIKRGFDSKTLNSGFSDHLPVFLTIEIQE